MATPRKASNPASITPAQAYTALLAYANSMLSALESGNIPAFQKTVDSMTPATIQSYGAALPHQSVFDYSILWLTISQRPVTPGEPINNIYLNNYTDSDKKFVLVIAQIFLYFLKDNPIKAAAA
jgi:hypothetical protein